MTNQEFIESIRMDEEEFKPVIGYEDLYMISSYGRVVALKYIRPFYNNASITQEPKLVKIIKNKYGYMKVRLSKNKKRQEYSVHRLVALNFIPNPDSKPEVDHIDTIRSNNHVSNLRWVTKIENMNNPLSRKNISSNHYCLGKKGLDNPFSIKIIRIDRNGNTKIYPSTRSVKQDGFTQSNVLKCCKKEHKQHKGYKWMYLSDYETLTNMSKNSLSTGDD